LVSSGAPPESPAGSVASFEFCGGDLRIEGAQLTVTLHGSSGQTATCACTCIIANMAVTDGSVRLAGNWHRIDTWDDGGGVAGWDIGVQNQEGDIESAGVVAARRRQDLRNPKVVARVVGHLGSSGHVHGRRIVFCAKRCAATIHEF